MIRSRAGKTVVSETWNNIDERFGEEFSGAYLKKMDVSTHRDTDSLKLIDRIDTFYGSQLDTSEELS